jgi:leucyl-tRNA synthetase
MAGSDHPARTAPDVRIRAANHDTYRPHEVERHWQLAWQTLSQSSPPPSLNGRRRYVFPSCPFTSGSGHMGHARNYVIADVYARYRRARGDSVLFSIGFDAFGLPVEIEAVKRNMHPTTLVSESVSAFRRLLVGLGISLDWEQSFVTSDPDIYQWAQRLFLMLYRAGFIYQSRKRVPSCPRCETTLARAQAPGGRCWRCHGMVRTVERDQWFFRSTAYVNENEHRIHELTGWNAVAVRAQKAFLGTRHGIAAIAYGPSDRPLRVFTPHHECLMDAHFVAISPNATTEIEWLSATANVETKLPDGRGAVRRDERHASQVPIRETGVYVRIPSVPWELPVIVSPYIDDLYGACAAVGIPSVDRRDELIAERLLTRRRPIDPGRAMPAWEPDTRHSVGDFSISRERPWGVPVPILHCDTCGIVPVPDSELPVRVRPSLSERNRAARTRGCPCCGCAAQYSPATIDCHMDGLWTWIAMCVPAALRQKQMFCHPAVAEWLPADVIRGADGAGYVFDQRTLAKMLRDIGVLDLPSGEPFSGMMMHEMVLRSGQKMSKHLGNVVDPSVALEDFGADSVRLAVLSMGGPGRSVSWDDGQVVRCHRFLRRLWRFCEQQFAADTPVDATKRGPPDADHTRRRLDQWCDVAQRRMTKWYDEMELHRAVSDIMRFAERIEQYHTKVSSASPIAVDDEAAIVDALQQLLRLLFPLAPHVAEELWTRSGGVGLLASASWQRPDVSYD